MLHASALIYNLVILPVRVTFSLLFHMLSMHRHTTASPRLHFTVREQADLIRLLIAALSIYFLLAFTNPSAVYHWIRGQADFKIIFLKTLCEIIHTMLTLVALSNLNNFAREF